MRARYLNYTLLRVHPIVVVGTRMMRWTVGTHDAVPTVQLPTCGWCSFALLQY